MSQVRHPLCLGVLLDNGAELDSRSNIVNVRLDMLGNAIPKLLIRESRVVRKQQDSRLAANLHAGSAGMLMFIELSFKQILHFMRIGIESQPPLVIGVYNSGLMNPRGLKPPTNRVNRIF
jgi:hypothetical protein